MRSCDASIPKLEMAATAYCCKNRGINVPPGFCMARSLKTSLFFLDSKNYKSTLVTWDPIKAGNSCSKLHIVSLPTSK